MSDEIIKAAVEAFRHHNAYWYPALSPHGYPPAGIPERWVCRCGWVIEAGPADDRPLGHRIEAAFRAARLAQEN